MYPQGNGPDNWNQYEQQPYPQDPYAPQQPYPQDPYAAQQPPPYPMHDPYQQGYPGTQFPGPGAPRPASSKVPLIIVGAVVGGFLLFCAAAVLVVGLSPSDNDADPTAANSPAATGTSDVTAAPTTAAPTPTSSGSASGYDLEGDLEQFKQGDCLTITGADREVKRAKCTDAGALKVFLRRDGVDASRDDVCDAVDDDTTDILYIDDTGIANDLVLCVGKPR
jgi:hypothetical protein